MLVENNTIYKYFMFILFTEIIMSLKVLFLEHEEKTVKIKET